MIPAVRLLNISKSFGAVRALDDVSLEVERGSIHGLVGENGAGKTTLMRVLYGAITPDAGSIEVEGHAHSFRTSGEANRAGVGMVSQHYGVIPALTCLQNLILGAEGSLILQEAEQEERASNLAARMGFSFEWRAVASTLSPAATQKLEILKLLWRESRIIILDEPTAMLSPADADALFVSLQSLVAEGATVILVTHRLPEVIEHCSRVTVLRNGRRVAERAVQETTPSELAHLIVGEDSDAVAELTEPGSRHPGFGTSGAGPPALSFESVTVLDERRHPALANVSFQVDQGEVVGVAGVDGNGQRELLRSILGILAPASGRILIVGQEQEGLSTADRLRSGLRIIPEDRGAEGLIESWPLEANCALGLQRLPALSSRGILATGSARTLAQRVVERFTTRHGGMDLPVSSLSGGNQQRLVAARALELDPKLLIAFQPARGLDFAGTADVYRGIREECVAGMAALVISFDLDELLLHCDRIVVLNRGALSQPPSDRSMNREAIGRLMVSA